MLVTIGDEPDELAGQSVKFCTSWADGGMVNALDKVV
jgi:hypothetical protein